MEVDVIETATIVNDQIIGQSLQITLVGIVILFASLFLLWGVMELLVRIIKDPVEKEEVVADADVVEVAPVVLGESELKMRAAAAAVASIQNYDLKMKVAAAAAAISVQNYDLKMQAAAAVAATVSEKTNQ